MVEGARLERVYTGNRIEGSNPSLSASPADTMPWRDIAAGHWDRFEPLSGAGQ